MTFISHWLIELTMTPKELKQWREANKYSQNKLAELLSVHIMTVSRWERGAREIPPFLKLALDYLELKGERPKPKKPKSGKEKVKREENIYRHGIVS